jgi:hypothetical protein
MEDKYSTSISSTKYQQLEKRLNSFTGLKDLYSKIVNVPFQDRLLTSHVDLGVLVLLQVNEKTKTIDRIALSDTDFAKKAVQVSAKDFRKIKIPLNQPDNIIALSIKINEFKITDDWTCMFNPILTPEQARLNQANAGIECSLVYPLLSGKGGALIYSFYQPQSKITDEHLDFVSTYSMIVDDAINEYYRKKRK